jgi:hypothetical protein
MSTFEAKVYRLTIEPHPNADKLELAAVGDFRAVVGKGLYKTGDLGVYVQEGSIVPKWLCEKYEWKLAGPDANRVKAIRLRSILSQGIIVPIRPDIEWDGEHVYTNGTDGFITLEDGTEHEIIPGEDMAALLGITKYEPPIPVHMAGEVWNAFGYTLSYDIENFKKFPDILIDGEQVVMTEKLHGTWTCLGYHPDVGPVITSKGMSGQGLALKMNDANKDNLYIRSLNATTLGVDVGDVDDTGEPILEDQNIIDRMIHLTSGIEPFYILGETYGKGVQDLAYGTKSPEFRVFDIYVGQPGQGRYLNFDELDRTCGALSIPMVPILYLGEFTKEKLNIFTNGVETISGQGQNIREGLVVKPTIERRNELIGRIQLKSVSEAYLLRKGEVTELQ